MKCTVILFSVVACVVSLGCSNETSVYKETEIDRASIIDNCITTKDFQVPVKDGYTTVVKYGEDTLAVTNIDYTIEVPKTATIVESKNSSSAKSKVSTRATTDVADVVTYTYIANALMPDIEEGYAYAQYWQAVLFEDLLNGDNDYNDLIIHVKKESGYNTYTKKYNIKVSIQPIALGSSNTIALGFYTADGTKHYVTQNCRDGLFGGKTGFINTEDYTKKVYYPLTQVYDGTFEKAEGNPNSIIWFIESGGQTFYAVSEKLSNTGIQKQTINSLGNPYGLVIYSSLKNYAQERVPLSFVYTQFNAWLKGDVTDFINSCTDDTTKVFYSWNKNNTVDIWNY